MATTAMTKTLVKELKTDISRLLGRGRKAFPCPLNAQMLAKLWHNMLPPDTVAAYQLLKDREFDTNSMCVWSLKFDTQLESGRYELQLVNRVNIGNGTQIFLSPEFDTVRNPESTSYKDSYYRTERQMAHAFPDVAKYPDFIQWIENMAIIERDFSPALATLLAILEWCGTVGQLVRAVPDLHKYLPKDRQALLKQQSRSSNMPYEWASLDRKRVDNLQFSMAKASLMPAQNEEWGDIYVTGAHFAP